MKSEKIYYFGTSEQIKLLEDMTNKIPEGTIKERGGNNLNSSLRAKLLAPSTVEISPYDSFNISLEIDLTNITCFACNEDYVDLKISQYNYRVFYRKIKLL